MNRPIIPARNREVNVQPDMEVSKARDIRAQMCTVLDECDIYPRRGSEVDAASLALFLRMAEIHESVCILVELGRHRDAVILARTICEAQIDYYWLTNKDITERFDRYIQFGKQIRALNDRRLRLFYDFEEDPLSEENRELIAGIEETFGNKTQWNKLTVKQMAEEPDEFDPDVDKTSTTPNAQYELFYFWFSLFAHPCAEAIQNFFPPAGEPFTTGRAPDSWSGIPEETVIFFATTWLFTIFARIDLALGLQQDPRVSEIFAQCQTNAPL